MRYYKFVLLLFAFLPFGAFAQQDSVVMMVNGKPISRAAFIYKLRQDSLTNLRGKALKVYAYKYAIEQLKVCAAEKAGLDTLSAFRGELTNYRYSLVRDYLTEQLSSVKGNNKESGYAKAKVPVIIQIYRHLLQNSTSRKIEQEKQRMDSLYNVLRQKPELFSHFVSLWSDNRDTMRVASMDYPEEFEKYISTLSKDHFTEPFFTSEGIHMVKLIGYDEICNNKKVNISIDTIVNFTEKLKRELNYIPVPEALQELKMTGETNKTLFYIERKPYKMELFKKFAKIYPMEINRQIDKFILKSILDFETKKLEYKYPDFSLRINNFRDDLLVQEENKILVPVNDSLALNAYFEAHKSDYSWDNPRYKGIVLHCVDKKTSRKAKKLIKKEALEKWGEILKKQFNIPSKEIYYEEGVFAEGDNSAVDDFIFKRNKYTPPSGFPTTVLIGEKCKSPDDYRCVLNKLLVDYRNSSERQMEEHLRSLGKVEINEEVLKTVNN